MGKLLNDERFKNVDYRHTNLQKTFARIRAQMKVEAEAKQANETEAASKVRQLVHKEAK